MDRPEIRGQKAGVFQHWQIRELRKGSQYVFGPLETGTVDICVLCEGSQMVFTTEKTFNNQKGKMAFC